ncbi:MAG: type IV secretory system conjugative DNA transfer family protein [Albidovulum sp.]|nr:type IV secretory system conjugative DNA transfer family protein [Albidovulum sp.]
MASKWSRTAAMAFLLCAGSLLSSACDFTSRTLDAAISERAKNSPTAEFLRRGPEPPSRPEELSIERAETDPSNELAGLRLRALKDAAQAYGSQHGYVRRSWEIHGILERKGRELSMAYDFRQVAEPAPSGTGYVVPPAVSLSLNLVRTNSAEIAFAADERYEIARRGQLAPMVPTWRDYLLFYPQSPVPLPESLKPVGDEEEILFRKWLELGWKAGIEQANAELEARLSKLRQDFEGMLRYKRLVERGNIEKLALESTGPASFADSRILRTGERTARIVAQAGFRIDDPKNSSGARESLSEETSMERTLK